MPTNSDIFELHFSDVLENETGMSESLLKNTEHLEISVSLSIHCKTLSQMSVLYCV